jgi:hypothetical protein
MTDNRQPNPSTIDAERGAQLWRALCSAATRRDARTGQWQVIGSDGVVLADCETSGQAERWISLR